MITHYDIEQRTPEWFAVRLGKVTSSCMADVLAKGRGNQPSKTRHNYMVRLIAERLSGQPQPTYCNGAMEWGIQTEPAAREAYEADTMTVVQQVGFVELNEYVGCSPDGFVGDDGLIEIKCGNTTTHLNWILENRMPPEYINQVQSQLFITGRKYCHFISFDPRLTVRPYWMIEVKRDENKITEIKEGVEKFTAEMLELEKKILTM